MYTQFKRGSIGELKKEQKAENLNANLPIPVPKSFLGINMLRKNLNQSTENIKVTEQRPVRRPSSGKRLEKLDYKPPLGQLEKKKEVVQEVVKPLEEVKEDPEILNYELEFNQILQQLRSLQEEKSLKTLPNEQLLQLTDKMRILISQWNLQTDLVKKLCLKESLLQGLILIIKQIENCKIKIRAIVLSISVLRTLGIKNMLHNTPNKEVILPPEAVYEHLIVTLGQAQKLTKEKQSEGELVSENVSASYFQLLNSISQNVTPAEINDRVIDLLTLIYNIMKQESSIEGCRRRYFEAGNIRLAGYFLHYFELSVCKSAKLKDKVFQLYTSITALLRNLAIDVACTAAYLKNDIVSKLTTSIQQYYEENELMLNTVRILSKISLNQDCSLKMFENTHFTKNILSFFKIFKSNLFIIIRISFILANMTTFIEDIRKYIYFDLKGMRDIYDCFCYYSTRELSAKNNNQIDQMGVTMTGWDFKTMKDETDQDALIKIIRLIANLLTVEEIGNDLFQNDRATYKELVKRVRFLIHDKSVEQHEELIFCGLSLLANLTFYDKTSITTDFEYKSVQLELVSTVTEFSIQTKSEEICCESLRVIANLSRHKELYKQFVKTQLVEALVILLDSNSLQIVYYNLGALINLLQNEEIKMNYGNEIIESTLQIIEDSTVEGENDIIQLGLKCIGNLVDQNRKLNPSQMKRLEEILQKCGTDCDNIIQKTSIEESQNIDHVHKVRKLINQIINIIPEEHYECLVPNCGRKFQSQEDLDRHVQRRHGL